MICRSCINGQHDACRGCTCAHVVPVDRNLSVPVAVGECVPWTAAKGADGYGAAWDPETKKVWRASRLAYTRACGPIPDGMEIDHLCGRIDCANVDHLEAVTGVENMRRRGSRVTACPQGHPYTEANTMWTKTAGNGRRKCRACHNERQRVRAAKKRAAKDAPTTPAPSGPDGTAPTTPTPTPEDNA